MRPGPACVQPSWGAFVRADLPREVVGRALGGREPRHEPAHRGGTTGHAHRGWASVVFWPNGSCPGLEQNATSGRSTCLASSKERDEPVTRASSIELRSQDGFCALWQLYHIPVSSFTFFSFTPLALLASFRLLEFCLVLERVQYTRIRRADARTRGLSLSSYTIRSQPSRVAVRLL